MRSRLFHLLAYLPLHVLHNLGAVIGWLAWLLSPIYRRHMRVFMEKAGLQAYRNAAIAESGKTILEMPKLWLRPFDEVVSRVVRVSGADLVQKTPAAKRGLIILTPHLGCFEIVGQYLVSVRPLTAMYRPSKHAWLEPIIQAGRGARITLAPTDLSGVRRVLKALKAGEAIIMAPDQIPGKGEGAWAPFFGHPAYTMTLAARLSETDAEVVFGYAERLPYGSGYHLHFRAPAEPLHGTLDERTAQINGEIEVMVRECPAQYLWSYNRYKVPRHVGLPP
ncbi:MAG: lysophospholipid acyltransferase family protein [Rhodocyclaceae bacterium]|jgi:KDO2-lipid IV(A) lauroyltransferase|nr:lysophospholipid acyltransferase family protein [Rhodocyclaceae bacterium]